MRGMVQAMRHPGLLHGAQGLRGKRELSTSLRETVTSLCSPVACSCAAQAPATVNEQRGVREVIRVDGRLEVVREPASLSTQQGSNSSVAASVSSSDTDGHSSSGRSKAASAIVDSRRAYSSSAAAAQTNIHTDDEASVPSSSQLSQVQQQQHLQQQQQLAVPAGLPVSSLERRLPSAAPVAPPLTNDQLEHLVELLTSHRRVVALTGAGISTESGVPDYRGPQGAYTRHGFRPMTHQQFMAGPEQRARYFARSFFGWHEFSNSKPAGAHIGLARLVNNGWIDRIITQNVDRLHHKAGTPAEKVVELHGTTHVVHCLSCGRQTSRQELQARLAQLNPASAKLAEDIIKQTAANKAAAQQQQQTSSSSPPPPPPPPPSLSPSSSSTVAHTASQQHPQAQPSLQTEPVRDSQLPQQEQSSTAVDPSSTGGGSSLLQTGSADEVMRSRPSTQPANPGPQVIPVQRPDGDVELQDAGKGFIVPPCDHCGGILKPYVVFFGDNIPKERTLQSIALAEEADLLLVIGSSLMVYSAYRLVEACKRYKGKVALINVGETRADQVADLKLEVLAGEACMRLATHPRLLVPRV